MARQIRLPNDKLAKAVSKRGAVTKKALESLTGLLQFMTKVVQPERPFLRRLYALKDVGSLSTHPVRQMRLLGQTSYGGICLPRGGMASQCYGT